MLHILNNLVISIKATQVSTYFLHYLRVVITLFSTGLYKSAFFTYSFGETRFSSFCVLAFYVSISLGLGSYIFLLYVLNSMSSQNT